MRLRYTAVGMVLFIGLSLSLMAGTAHSSPLASKSPIVIGVVGTLSGPFGDLGSAALDGAKVAVAQLNAHGGILGHPVSLNALDDQGNGTQSVQQLTTLAGKHVYLVVNAGIGGSCTADRATGSQLGVVQIVSVCGDPTLTLPGTPPYFFRVDGNSNMYNIGLGLAVCRFFKGVTSYDALDPDLQADTLGYQMFGRQVARCGAHPGNALTVPLTATDVTPFVSNLQSHLTSSSAKTAILYNQLFSGQLANFIAIATSINLFKQYRAVMTFSSGWDSIAAQLYPNIPHVYAAADYYQTAFKTPANTTFIKETKKVLGHAPGTINADGYRAVMAFAAAITKARSTQALAVANALAGLTFNDMSGPVTFNASTHQANVPVVVRDFNGPKVTVPITLRFNHA